MQKQLTWKKGVFSNLYEIFSNGKLIGKLKEKFFSQNAIGEIQGKEYIFRAKGFFKPQTLIIDSTINKQIGEITFNNWMTKATITIGNKRINWKYDNIWNTKWSLYNSQGIDITYAGSSAKGQIESNIEDILLILSGLYVQNYYWQMAAAIFIILIPVWMRLIN